MKAKISILLLVILGILLLGIFNLISNSQSCSTCYPITCTDYCSGNTAVHCSCEVGSCCEYNITTGECIRYNYYCRCQSEDCDKYDKWVCGCPGYRSDKYKCFEDWYCSGGSCTYKYTNPTYCGASTDSDGGDAPRTRGTVTDRYCSGGSCTSSTYTDYCSGICSRSELIEYYIENDRVASKSYTDLFSKNQYCKNGAIYDDIRKPDVSISPSERNWDNRDITVTLYCNDNDESGCWKYNYEVKKIL
jgi:hypothetical protein